MKPLTHFYWQHRVVPLLLLATTLTATAAEPAPPRYKTSVPPSVELGYAVKAVESGIPLEGTANVQWTAANGKFALKTEMRAMLLGKILNAQTEGIINEFGLAPLVFTEKRMRKAAHTVTFNREEKRISFSNADVTYPIHGGEQDRNSAIWQLISVARAKPALMKTGAELRFFVASHRDAETWLFKVLRQQKIRTPMGNMNTVQLLKTTRDDDRRQKIEIWLAPSLEWYPVKLRYTDHNGDMIEQTLTSVTKKALR